jgi:hypothetical protein
MVYIYSTERYQQSYFAMHGLLSSQLDYLIGGHTGAADEVVGGRGEALSHLGAKGSLEPFRPGLKRSKPH